MKPFAALSLLILVAAQGARAQTAVTGRDYTIDAYRGAAIADYRVVGMGGVSLATAEGATGLLSNPAAAASRPATASGWFYWDFLFDAYTPGLSDDFDNNGVAQDQFNGATGALNAGLLGMFGPWGAALSITAEGRTFTPSGGTPASLSAAIFRLTLARSFLDGEIVGGMNLAYGGFTLRLPVSGVELVDAGNWSIETGALWQPREQNLRLGLNFRPRIRAGVDPTACDPNNCAGYILPDRVEFPWSAGAGVAWRFAPTPWNRRVSEEFREEVNTIVAADLIVDGPVANGSGLEAFLEKQLQPSGQSASLSVRLGAEHEWVPGRFRIRGGAYWEPPRFDDVQGRLHLTVGLDVRIWSFALWGSNYRLRLSLAGDGARRYGNTALSLGFWH